MLLGHVKNASRILTRFQSCIADEIIAGMTFTFLGLAKKIVPSKMSPIPKYQETD